MSRSGGATRVTSRRRSWTVPAVTFSSPAIIRSSVDLPQPDGPTSTTNSPVADLQRDVVDRVDAAVVDLRHALERDRRSAHPFTAVEASDRTNVRCAARKASSTGSVASTLRRHDRRLIGLVRGS